MKSKLVIGVALLFLSGVLSGGLLVNFGYAAKPLWILPGLLILPVALYFFLYSRLVKPYLQILSGMRLLNEQDFTTRLRAVKNKEAREMARVFNRMMASLRNERLSVREKNRFLDLLIEASPQGILILNFNEQVTDINASGLRLLNIADARDVKGKKLWETPSELAVSLASLKKEDNVIIRTSGACNYRCIRSSFVDQGFEHPFILIEELTRELLKVEKESYERIIRMMSHEVNNSVGAIGSTLHVVSDVINSGEQNAWQDVLPAVDASSDRCKHLAQFISKLANVVKIPLPTLTYVSLNEQVRAVDALTRIECRRRDIKLTLQLSPEDRLVRIDGIQFEQVLVNIIKNAYESIGHGGEIRIITSVSPLSITIQDNGPGITHEVNEKLFTPFFTTKSSGQGIGLMFVRDVLVNHQCRFSLYTSGGWTRFEIIYKHENK